VLTISPEVFQKWRAHLLVMAERYHKNILIHCGTFGSDPARNADPATKCTAMRNLPYWQARSLKRVEGVRPQRVYEDVAGAAMSHQIEQMACCSHCENEVSQPHPSTA
jgi:hypothetical protein